MTKEIICPKCGSHKVRSYDNETLYHPCSDELEEGAIRYDSEVYIMFNCDICGEQFKNVFDLISKEKQISVVGNLKTPLQMTQDILKSVNKSDAPEEVLIETYLEIMINRHKKAAIEEYIKKNQKFNIKKQGNFFVAFDTEDKSVSYGQINIKTERFIGDTRCMLALNKHLEEFNSNNK